MSEDKKSPVIIEIGKRVLNRRKELDLTQEQVAEKADITAQFLSSIESGKKGIRAENIINLARALDVSTDYLLTGRCNLIDVNRVNSLLRSFNSEELILAENFLRKLQAVCKYSEEDPDCHVFASDEEVKQVLEGLE